MKREIKLRYLIPILIVFTSVSLLIYFTQQFHLYWFLYAIPLLAAALVYETQGAVVMSLIVIIALLFWVFQGGTFIKAPGGTTHTLLETSLGTLTLIICTIGIGRLMGKQKKQQSLLSRLSIYDRLTGLYNYSYFTDRLHQEILRADRFETNLSLIMIDIDHFKNFNDTFGHTKGNLLLKKLAGIIRHQVRDIDIPARYGGEEFVIILPETKISSGRIVAERIRKTIEKTDFEGDREEPKVKKTISAGIACFPFHASNETELIVNADRALYEAKETGRNRVCIFTDILAKKTITTLHQPQKDSNEK